MNTTPPVAPAARRVCLTVDVEQDCPPYLNTWRGLDEGLPRLLEVLAGHGVQGTFFTTGETARKFPQRVGEIVAAGHELGSHGDTHRRFTTMNATAARDDLAAAAATLRAFAPVRGFRAPWLDFPAEFVPLLAELGFAYDSSQARYKFGARHRPAPAALPRVAASATSSVLRLPRVLRRPWLAALTEPAVLFVHPWEFVDFRAERRMRWDCRFRTGPAALAELGGMLADEAAAGTVFLRMDALPETRTPARPNAPPPGGQM